MEIDSLLITIAWKFQLIKGKKRSSEKNQKFRVTLIQGEKVEISFVTSGTLYDLKILIKEKNICWKIENSKGHCNPIREYTFHVYNHPFLPNFNHVSALSNDDQTAAQATWPAAHKFNLASSWDRELNVVYSI